MYRLGFELSFTSQHKVSGLLAVCSFSFWFLFSGDLVGVKVVLVVFLVEILVIFGGSLTFLGLSSSVVLKL